MKLPIHLFMLLAVYMSQCNSDLSLSRNNSDVENPGLYDENDKVIVLMTGNLTDKVMDKKYSTLLEFYNSNCGYCKRFAPKYKQLAESLYPWRNVLQVAALNCADDRNIAICRQYEIISYPSLRYFGPHYISGEDSIGTRVETQDLDEITDIMARFLVAQTPVEPSWPTFANLIEYDPKHLFQDEPLTVQYLFVISEPDNSTIGAQTILNFNPIKEVRIRRTTNKKLTKAMGIETFNLFKVFKRSGEESSIHLANVSPSGLKAAIENYLAKENVRSQDPDVENPGLYDENDKVIVLMTGNLTDKVMDKKYSTLLEFYNSNCGYCKRFAPKYKQLAGSLYPWRNVLQVAALNCADDRNVAICRQYEIRSYPSLRYFGPHYISGEDSIGTRVETQDLDEITDIMARFLVAQTPVEPSWPTFANLIEYDPKHLFQDEPLTVQYLFVIFEPDNSTIGAQTILNFNPIKEVRIRRTTNKKLTKAMGIETFNLLKVFKRRGEESSIHLANVSSSGLKAAIENYLAKENVSSQESDTSKFIQSTASYDDMFLQEILKMPRHLVYQSDLEHALRYTIFHEIPTIANISGERLLALQRYLGVLSRYNPLGENGRLFIDDLKNFVYSHSQELLGKKFQEKVFELEQLYTPIFSSNKWIGCRPSKTGFRGYTCGLWTLFHSITIQASDDETATDPLEVLKAIHGYVKFYFECTDCSQHFQDMASRRKIWNTTTKDDAVLWLWAAHNEVNKRLAGDQTEDPKFPKVQFPIKDSCPACYREFSEHSSSDSSEPNWNKLEVLAFLKRIHNHQNISRFGVNDPSVLPDTLSKMRSKRMASNIFSDIDMRMGILLYIFCIGMMFLAVKLFLKKGYRKKPYPHGVLGKV